MEMRVYCPCVDSSHLISYRSSMVVGVVVVIAVENNTFKDNKLDLLTEPPCLIKLCLYTINHYMGSIFPDQISYTGL